MHVCVCFGLVVNTDSFLLCYPILESENVTLFKLWMDEYVPLRPPPPRLLQGWIPSIVSLTDVGN